LQRDPIRIPNLDEVEAPRSRSAVLDRDVSRSRISVASRNASMIVWTSKAVSVAMLAMRAARMKPASASVGGGTAV
jgi:hypothetical protein